MDADFPRSLQLVLVDEGGLDDDPHDHGGRTAHGIIQREYDGYRARHGLAQQDVWKITPAEYTEIYHDRYWVPWCPNIPAGLDYAFFDYAVNAGPVQAVRTLQKVLGLRVDGHMGEVMLDKVQEATADERALQDFIHKFCDSRRAFYRALAQFPRYGLGWLARVDHVEHAAVRIAATGVALQRRPVPEHLREAATARAQAEKPASTSVDTGTAATATTASGIGAGLMAKLEPFVAKLQDMQGVVHGVEYVLLGITLFGLGYTLYTVWHASKVREAIA